jgi:aminotransferase in exopolysaccharide biosynthesis
MDICIDSNVLIYAFNAQSQFNARAEAILEELILADGFAIADISLIEFYQIITNDKLLSDPISPDKSYEIIKDILLNKKIEVLETNIDILKLTFESAANHNVRKYEIYDHLIANLCKHNNIKQFITGNDKDFKKYDFFDVINPFSGQENKEAETKEYSKVIPLSVPSIQGNEWKYIKECLDTEWVSSAGKYVELFEDKICEFTGAQHAVACVNGTAALQVALQLSGVRPGDEVIVPTLTFIAPVNAVRYLNAQPLFMDADDYYNIDVDQVIKFLKEETKLVNSKSMQDDRSSEAPITINKKTGSRIAAVIPVHVFGNAVDLEKLMPICKERNIKIIEDATESLGTCYTQGGLKGKHTGTIGDIGCFSFNGNKIITTGGGGMIVTDNEEYAKKTRYLTTQAKDDDVRYIHNEIGYNFRLTNIQAAMGVAQMEQLPEYLKTKKRNYQLYKNEIDKISGLHLAATPGYADNNCWMYALQIDKSVYGKDREQLMDYLTENKIQTRPVWHLNHLQKPYKTCQNYKIEKANELIKKTINIPCSVNLKKLETEYIIKLLRNG